MNMSEGFNSAVTVRIQMVDADGEMLGFHEIRNDENEIQVFSSYGIEGTYIEACIYVIDKVTASVAKPLVGGLMEVTISGIDGGKMLFTITDVRYQDTDGDENWRLEITGETPLYYILRHCEYNGTIDLGKSASYGEAIAELIKAGLEANDLGDEPFKVYYNPDGVKKAYESIFCFNETVAFAINKMAHELCLEYYYSPFESAVYIGAPSPSDDTIDIGNFEALASSGKHVKYAIPGASPVTVYDVVMPGSLLILPGSMVAMSDGNLWKAVKASYYASGQGEREQHVKLIPAGVTCDQLLLAVLGDADIKSSYPGIDPMVKIADVDLLDPRFRPSAHGVYKALVAPVDSSKQDSGAWDFDDNVMMKPLTMTTPYAGDGVGLLFPAVEKGRSLVFHPNGHRNIGYIGPMTWKEGKESQQVPVKENDDFLLRLKEAELYFDAADKCWLLRGSKIVIHADDPAAASSKPSLAAGTAYITIQSDGNVVIEGATIKLGEGASKFVALADHVHDLTSTICAAPGSPVTGTLGQSSSNSTKTKVE